MGRCVNEEDERDLFSVVGGQGKEGGGAEIGAGGNSTEYAKSTVAHGADEGFGFMSRFFGMWMREAASVGLC